MNRIDRFKLVSGYILGGIAYIACFAIAAQIEKWWLNVLLCLFGGILGWCVGMFISPLDKNERHEFFEYGKAVSAFLSGFVIAKLDRLFSGMSASDLLTAIVSARLLLFGTTFCLGLQFTFVGRRYFQAAETLAK